MKQFYEKIMRLISAEVIMVGLFISIIVFIIFVLVSAVGSPRIHKYDSTDPGNGVISGLDLLTDNMTGCQYLSTPRGGIAPRLDRDGKHICN